MDTKTKQQEIQTEIESLKVKSKRLEKVGKFVIIGTSILMLLREYSKKCVKKIINLKKN
jgi:hypothetical protein